MSKKQKNTRLVEVLVLSDIHLGTYGCHAKELLNYLKTIQPQRVILNGDIIDIWQFKKHYWPNSHMKIIKHIINWITNGVTVYYITGNHDEMLRKFENFSMNSFKIVNKLVLEFDGKKAWFFHGDVFDVTMQHSKWLTKLGAVGYDVLIVLNSVVNKVSALFGKGKISLSKKIKDSVKSAVTYINNFEETAANIALDNNYDYVICGHIHQPKIKVYANTKQEVLYLNSGDWIENLTALEYTNATWTIYKYDETVYAKETKQQSKHDKDDITDQTNKEIFNALLKDFNLLKSK